MIDPKDLQAKSDQMNAIDLPRPMIFWASKIEYKPGQPQCISIHFEGHDGRPYKPCKSMLRGLDSALGRNEQDWNNRFYEIYCDPSVMWGGEEVGGIKISGISGLTEPHKFTVRKNRAQRYIHTFSVIPDDQEVVTEYIETHWQDAINECKSDKEITDVLAMAIKQFGAEKIEGLRDTVIAARDKFKDKEPPEVKA